jgi:hypothetical protein
MQGSRPKRMETMHMQYEGKAYACGFKCGANGNYGFSDSLACGNVSNRSAMINNGSASDRAYPRRAGRSWGAGFFPEEMLKHPGCSCNRLDPVYRTLDESVGRLDRAITRAPPYLRDSHTNYSKPLIAPTNVTIFGSGGQVNQGGPPQFAPTDRGVPLPSSPQNPQPSRFTSCRNSLVSSPSPSTHTYSGENYNF